MHACRFILTYSIVFESLYFEKKIGQKENTYFTTDYSRYLKFHFILEPHQIR